MSSNQKKASEFVKKYYIHSIIEAAAYGFTVPKNSCVDRKMYFAVEEANYRSKKFISYDEMKKIRI